MKGKIIIDAIEGMGIGVDVDIHNASLMDICAIFDGLASGLGLDEQGRKKVGLVFISGGIKNIPGVVSTNVELDDDLITLFRSMREKENETDVPR